MLLSLRSVKRSYPVSRGILGGVASRVSALRGVSLDLGPGEVLGVVGESGCGKSTLARMAAGLETPDSGEVLWEGRDLATVPSAEMRRLRRNVQLMFQNPFASLDPRQKVGESLVEPLEIHGGGRSVERWEAAAQMLDKVGLSLGDLDHYPHQFSGGQRQRIALARALMLNPKVLILDEPLSNLDVSVQASVLNLLVDINSEFSTSFLFISHDLDVVSYLSHRVLVLYLGEVVEEGPTREVLSSPRHPYTRALLESAKTRRLTVTGEPPNPASPPPGCSFHPRCPHAEAKCRSARPEPLSAGKDRLVSCWKWENLS